MSLIATGRGVLDRARDAEVTFLAAAIAYYALVSVVPALLLAVAVATTVGGVELAARVATLTGGLLTPAGQSAVEEALTGAGGRAGASVLGLLVLGWSTLRVFRAIDAAFSRIYGSSGRESFLAGLRDAGVALAAVGLGLWGMLGLGGALTALPLPASSRALGLAALLLGLFVAFLPLYVVFPDVSVREAAPGAAVAAVGWVGLQAGFQAYAAIAPAQLYGVLGGVLLLVTWFYFGAALLLVGAVVNAVLASRSGDRQAEKPPDREDGP